MFGAYHDRTAPSGRHGPERGLPCALTQCTRGHYRKWIEGPLRVMKGALHTACDDRPSATHELSLRSGRAALSAGIAWCNMASSAARSERARAEIINMSSGCRLEHHLWRMARCRFQVTPECLTHSCGIRPSAIGYSTSLRHAGGVLAA